MAWYRAVGALTHIDQHGKEQLIKPGELVDVWNRHTAMQLERAGLVVKKDQEREAHIGTVAKSHIAARRYGLYLTTSPRHSGGRLHLYQMMSCLADGGADIFILTNRLPRWSVDYPQTPRMKIFPDPKTAKIPPDLDVIITDAKGPTAEAARRYKEMHPSTKLVTMVFETENWVEKFCPDYAKRIANDLNRKVLDCSDLLLANSGESHKHMMEWLGKPKKKSGFLAPAVNTFALAEVKNEQKKVPDRPYAFWCARQVSYKGQREVAEAIWSMDTPFDLVMIQGSYSGKKDNDLHEMHYLENCTDKVKFKFMQHAEVVLAPSRFEGYGMIPQEALCCGTPCVVYDLPVLRESYGDSLIYVKRGDRAAYAKAVHKTIANVDEEKSKINVPKMIEKYGMDAMSKKVEHLPYCAVKRKSVSAMVIAYWGFCPEAVESVYKHVDEIIIAYGPTPLTKHIKPDGSLELIRGLKDPDHKIQVHEKKEWKDKLAMRNFITERITGNYMLVLDGDEIWIGLDKWLEKGPDYKSPAWCNLWHGGGHWVHDTADMGGRRWGKRLQPYGSTCPHYRWSFWRQSSAWKKHHTPVDSKGNALRQTSSNILGKYPNTMIYHLGHSLPKRIMQAKHDFYIKRDGEDPGRDRRMAAWHTWNGKTGDQGDGMVEKVGWVLPSIVKKALKGLEKRG